MAKKKNYKEKKSLEKWRDLHHEQRRIAVEKQMKELANILAGGFNQKLESKMQLLENHYIDYFYGSSQDLRKFGVLREGLIKNLFYSPLHTCYYESYLIDSYNQYLDNKHNMVKDPRNYLFNITKQNRVNFERDNHISPLTDYLTHIKEEKRRELGGEAKGS